MGKLSHRIKTNWLTFLPLLLHLSFYFLYFPSLPSLCLFTISPSIFTFKRPCLPNNSLTGIWSIPPKSLCRFPFFHPSLPPPFTPLYPSFWNHTSTLPRHPTSTSLPLLLTRNHNLSPVAWTPIPQCGCLIGFGCGCSAGARLQVVSS